MKTTYTLTINSVNPNWKLAYKRNRRIANLLPTVTLKSEENLLRVLNESEKEFKDIEQVRYSLDIYIDDMLLGHCEAPTVEMLLEKLGSFERWLERVTLEGQDLQQYIINSY